MVYKIDFTARFLREFDRAADYYLDEIQNPAAAEHMLEEFTKAVDFVSRLPFAGTPNWSGKRRKPYYYVDVGHYFAFYQVIGKKVVFRRFLHSRSDLSSKL